MGGQPADALQSKGLADFIDLDKQTSSGDGMNNDSSGGDEAKNVNDITIGEGTGEGN